MKDSEARHNVDCLRDVILSNNVFNANQHSTNLKFLRRVDSKIDLLLDHLGLVYLPEVNTTKPAEIVKKSKLAKDGRK